MKLKLACADFTFPLLPHDKVLDLISMLEFDGVDLGLFEGRSHLWPSKEYRNPARSGKAMGKKLSDRGLKAADVFLQTDPDFRPYAINHPETPRRRKARDWFDRTLDYAAAAGAKHVTALPGVLFEGESAQQSWDRSREELAWRIDRARQRKIDFSVEAHVGSLAPDPASAAKLVGDVPGLHLTLDYTHFTRVGLPDSAVEPLVKHATHFHARGARTGRLQAPVKENTIDYARVLRAMNKTGYRGYVGVEYVWIDWEHCNECDNLCETILLRDLLRREHKTLR